MALRTNLSISIVIPCHNYARFLPFCLQSIIGQTFQPLEIIVIDDSSTDDPESVVNLFKHPNISYHRFEHKNELLSRAKGVSLAKGDVICCIDADDTIGPQYLEKGLRVLMEDYRIAIAYSDYEYCGLMQGRSSFPESSLEADIEKGNFIHSGSLFRRDIANLTNAFVLEKKEKFVCDWYAWKMMLRAGFLAVKHEGIYNYFRHENSEGVVTQWTYLKPTYYQNARLSAETVSICMLIDETYDNWEQKKLFLEKQKWDHRKTNLQIFYLGNNELQTEKIRKDILFLDYQRVEFKALNINKNSSIYEFEIMQSIAERLHTEFFLFVNSFIVPPLDAIDKLLQNVCQGSSCIHISLTHKHLKFCAFDKSFEELLLENLKTKEATSMSFFCTLFRRGVFKKVFKDNLIIENLVGKNLEDLFYSSLSNADKVKVITETFCYLTKNKHGELEVPENLIEDFDEKSYLEANPDVKEAVENGLIESGKEHFKLNGIKEGREFKLKRGYFDEETYLKNYPSVNVKINAGQYNSAYQHYIQEGKEGGLRAFYCK